MGNSQSVGDFKAEQYQKNSGLSTEEVIGIRNVFESLEPKVFIYFKFRMD